MSKIKIIIVFVLTFMLGDLYVKALSGSYTVGDVITYNNVNYYVIANSDERNSSVTLLKAEPLTTAEVNQYGTGHVNMYVTSDTSASYYQTAYDKNGYGGMAYYSSATCGNGTYTGCTIDYAQSEVKYIVDAWKASKAPLASEARLLTVEDIYSLGYEWYDNGSIALWQKTDSTPSWMYNSNYAYWTMSPYNDSDSNVWRVSGDGLLDGGSVAYYGYVVRPIIVLSKDKEESAQDNTDSEESKDNNKSVSTEVDVPNTLLSEPYISTIMGGIIVIVSIIVCVVIINNRLNNRKDK